jgi:hypothetical protein
MTDRSLWRFDTDGNWAVTVNVAPHPDHNQKYYAAAVPYIAAAKRGTASLPCVVIARVYAAPAPGRRVPAGPRGRAKPLMDALHDDRRVGPKYGDFGARSPLPDDKPRYVRGFAVEVRAAAKDQVEYRLGRELYVPRTQPLVVDVNVAAPNDVAVNIAQQRLDFGRAVVRAWQTCGVPGVGAHASALVIRHRPGRDEDNTWETWIAAILGSSRDVSWTKKLWPQRPPLAGWAPQAIASFADPDLPCQVRYEVYADC